VNLSIMQKFAITSKQHFVAERRRVDFSQWLSTFNVPATNLIGCHLNTWMLWN